MNEYLTSPAVQNAAKEIYFPHPEYWILTCMTSGWGGETGKAADRTLRGHWRDMDSTNCVMNSIKKLSCKPQGTPCLQILPTGPWSTSVLSVLHTHTHIAPGLSCGWFFVRVPRGGGKNETWQTASEHTQKAGPILWAKEGPQTWILLLPLVKQKEGSHSTWPGVESREGT